MNNDNSTKQYFARLDAFASGVERIALFIDENIDEMSTDTLIAIHRKLDSTHAWIIAKRKVIAAVMAEKMEDE